jgi:hypothetical protein
MTPSASSPASSIMRGASAAARMRGGGAGRGWCGPFAHAARSVPITARIFPSGSLMSIPSGSFTTR